jgi:predicted  nucleic acid-binding Zn-ribbon protein
MRTDKNIKKAFDKVKEEMTDHLDSINSNTNEINANSTYIKELEKMIQKLNEKIDNFEILL